MTVTDVDVQMVLLERTVRTSRLEFMVLCALTHVNIMAPNHMRFK